MSEYKKALRVLMQSPVTEDMLKFLTNATLKVLPGHTKSAGAYPSPTASPTKDYSLPSLMTFISRLVRYTNVYTPTLLASVCYLNKLKRILPRDATGLPSTIHRLFLAALILSSKFHNDSSPKNKHWASYTDGLFSAADVNLMERQLLGLLNWDVRITDEDLILDLRPLLDPIVQDIERAALQRKKVAAARKFHSPKIMYDHKRNVSVASDLSAATLVGSNNDLPMAYSPMNAKIAAVSRSSSNSSIEIWQDTNMESSNHHWNLESIVSQL